MEGGNKAEKESKTSLRKLYEEFQKLGDFFCLIQKVADHFQTSVLSLRSWKKLKIGVGKLAVQDVKVLLCACLTQHHSRLTDSVLAALQTGHFANLHKTAIRLSRERKGGWGCSEFSRCAAYASHAPNQNKEENRDPTRRQRRHPAPKLWRLPVSRGGCFPSGTI